MAQQIQAPSAIAIEDTGTRLPLVSVLVPAWNEADRIGDCFESLLAIDWPNLEILVSAGGSDGTFEAASRFAGDRVLVIRQRPGQGKQAALRELFALSRGDVIYLTDGDCVVPSATFRAVVAPIIDREVDAVSGTYRPYRNALSIPLVFYQWSIEWAGRWRMGGETDGLCGANAAVSRLALAAAGGFRADVPIGTDVHLSRLLHLSGFHVSHIEAQVETEYPACLPAFVRRQSRWLRNGLVHGLHFRDRAFISTAMRSMAVGTAIVTFPLTWPVTRRWGILAWAAVFGWLIQRRITYARRLSTDLALAVPPSFLVRLPVFTLIDIASWMLAPLHFASRTRRTRW